MNAFIAILIWVISIILITLIGGEIRFRYLKKKSTNQKNNEEQSNNKENITDGYNRSELRPARNCCNTDTYGVICVRCGRCGRKF